jgi:hypothetical protein
MLSTGILTSALAHDAAAALSARLVSATVQASVPFSTGLTTAAALVSTRVGLLTEGVLQAMLMTKLKIVAVVLLAASVAGTGAGIVAYGKQAAEPANAASAQRSRAQIAEQQVRELEVAAAEKRLRQAKAELEAARADVERAKALAEVANAKVKGLAEQLEELNKPERSSTERTKGLSSRVSSQPVAYIFDKIPISREELGEYLIARAGNDKLEALVNQRIVEHACKQKGITVADAEVESALNEDVRGLGITRQQFVERVLAANHKTLWEWKQDVIRPRLLMTKLCSDRVAVSDDDIRDAFEAAYGEKVECRIILWPRDAKELAAVGNRVLRVNDEMFEALARKHPNPNSTGAGGATIVISRHATITPDLEKAAFQLQPGELSGLIDTPEGIAILKCVKRIPAERSRKLSDVREELAKQVWDKKIQAEIPKVFQELRKQAQPKLLFEP